MTDAPDTDDLRDQLPDDLDAHGVPHAYRFPDNSRRRRPGVLYVLVAVGAMGAWAVAGDESPLVNDGFLWAGVLFAVVGAFSISSGWRMRVDEQQALVAAQGAAGFPVGHASAQQVWRGLRSRPTWRVLVYSAEEPPTRRALVLVDAVDGRVVEQLVQDNPADDWAS